ncbi:hypothetical protein BN871_AJ_00780 [Paenibacillus sp. P22]|nr:hypothetical protein BN871_AJ_00780 [Paenibacillus sp. P22]
MPDAEHGVARQKSPEHYDAAVTAFLDRWLPGTAAGERPAEAQAATT